MKVLQIINDLSLGGAQKLLEVTVPLMKEAKGIEIEVLLLTDESNVFHEKLIRSGIQVHVIHLKKLRSPLNIIYIRRCIKNGGYDLVHAHLFPTVYWVSMASLFIYKNKPKFFFTEHSTFNRRRNKWYLRFFERFIYSRFDRIISISDSTQENLLKWLKLKECNKFIVIHNGIDIDKIHRAKPYIKAEIDSKFTDKIKLLCMVGRFSKAKDQMTIIRALKSLPNGHLLLVGEGPSRSKNEKLAIDIGVDDRVHFLGFRDDVGRLLKTCDIIIQSSNWEGFGLAAVEGMAAGKPVIVSNVIGLREIVDEAGILFDKGDSDELAKQINTLIIDDNRYEDVAQACLIRAKTFDIDIMVQNILLQYKGLNERGESA